MNRPVRFWAGFGVASVIWAGAAAYLVVGEGYGPPETEPALLVAEADPVVDEAVEEDPAPRRRRRARRRATASTPGESTPSGRATSGDDLREDEMRTLDLAGSGGEQQLSAAQIEAGFDRGMGRIRRCLVLMAGDDPVTGRLTFGLRVTSSGQVEAVRLDGPAAATTGDAGECLRTAARAIRFDPFDGPTMVVRYPLTLE